MSGCRHEHDDHNGGHDGHDHDHDDPERGAEFSLYRFIDTTHLCCLNEAEANMSINVFKPWHDRLNTDTWLESDADEQLILTIPFTGTAKIKGIIVIGESGEMHPSKVKGFINRDDIDFSNADELPATQEWDLHEDQTGALEYPTRMSKFQGVHTLVLYFSENFGAEKTRIYYIGLRGEFQQMKRDTIITVYEASANPADHKMDNMEATSKSIQ